eukprot:CAMPEP_0184503788 /NCGR_PEP_ID=MMETSP0113_2-20130426/52090_1 /TAXON_ID=91329 /ORGANISM="Norrisiella sphaerica, Strain BC52" /LENGTH=67 /DNA_ID=CAMNT_0026893345 /DNA_START=1332 /DNA_END=1532 /DNA_ORIENTATION=+
MEDLLQLRPPAWNTRPGGIRERLVEQMEADKITKAQFVDIVNHYQPAEPLPDVGAASPFSPRASSKR